MDKIAIVGGHGQVAQHLLVELRRTDWLVAQAPKLSLRQIEHAIHVGRPRADRDPPDAHVG